MTIKPCIHVFAITNIMTVAFLAIKNVNEIHKKSVCFIRRFVCPGTDLNRYDRCGSQDFKSCVSTNSTTRAGDCFGRSLASQKKSLHQRRKDFQSERPGSNRPPRPWQGRALPNELLSHVLPDYRSDFILKNFGVAKIGLRPFLKKFYDNLFVFGSI